MTSINNNTHGTDSVPLEKISCSTKTPLLFRVIKKIHYIVKKIFSLFLFWRWGKKKITTLPKVETINNIKNSELHNVKNKYIYCQDIIVYTKSDKSTSTNTFKTHSLDNSLIAFNNALTTVSNNFIEYYLNQLHQKSIQCVDKKSLNLIYKAAKPLIKEKFINSKTRILNLLEKIIFDENTSKRNHKMKSALNWILKDNETFFNELYAKTNQNENLPLKFISNFDQNFPELQRLDDKETFYTQFESVLDQLLKAKSANILNFLKIEVIENLPRLVLECIKQNSHLLSKVLIDKVTILLTKVDFKILIGQIIQTFTNHVKNVISAETKLKNSSLENEKIKNEFFSFFISEKNTHPHIKELFKDSPTNWDKRYFKYKEKEIIKKFIKTIESILLSEEKEKNLVDFMLNKIDYTVEINTFIQNFKDFLSHSVSSKLFQNELDQLIILKIKNTFSLILKKEINKLIYLHFHNLYKKLISPNEMINVFGNSLLPSMSQKLLNKHISNIILHNLKKLTPLLTKLRANVDDITANQKLKTKIYELVKKECILFNFESHKINFTNFSNSNLNEVINLILESFKNENLKNDSLQNILTALFHTPHLETDDRLSELFISLVFELGEFGGSFSKKIAAFGKNAINEVLGSSIYPFILHKYQIVDLFVKAMDKKFSTPELVNSFFSQKKQGSNETSSHSPRKTLTFEITKISSILHDIVMEGVRSSSNWMTLEVKKKIITSYIGENSTNIENAFITIFNKIFNKEYVNANLLFKIQDVMTNVFLRPNASVNNFI